MTFAAAAAALREKEMARLADALTPRIEALRSMTTPAFRATVALMLERFGHEVIGNPEAHDLVTAKKGNKFITTCAPPTDRNPAKIPALRRLHDAVIGANAQRGFFITPREFTAQALQYADTAPLDLFDGRRLIRALNQSRKGVLLPQTYKAMCHQCGGIVEHRIDREQDEARPCGQGHFVAPTIARAMLIPPRSAAPGSEVGATIMPAARPLSRREIKAHNARFHARMFKQQQRGGG